MKRFINRKKIIFYRLGFFPTDQLEKGKEILKISRNIES